VWPAQDPSQGTAIAFIVLRLEAGSTVLRVLRARHAIKTAMLLERRPRNQKKW